MSATPCASSACTVAPSSRRSRTTPDLSNPVPSPTTTTDDQAPSPPLPARARDHVAAVVPRRIAGARAVMSNEIVTEAMLLDLARSQTVRQRRLRALVRLRAPVPLRHPQGTELRGRAGEQRGGARALRPQSRDRLVVIGDRLQRPVSVCLGGRAGAFEVRERG